RLLEPGARLRQFLDPGGQLPVGPRQDERPGTGLRARRGDTSLAQRAPLVEARHPGAGRLPSGVKDSVAAYHGLLDYNRLTAASAEALASGQRAGRAQGALSTAPW